MSRAGLIAEYLFNGNAEDTSGHGRHGIVHGATPTADRFGAPNAALAFGGVDDHVVVAPPPPLSDRACSVSVWFRHDAPLPGGWNNCVLCQDDGDDGDEDQPRRVFQLSMHGHHLVWHRMCRARDPLHKRRLHPGVWYHAVTVCESGIHRLYLDGEPCDEVSDRLIVHPEQPMHIGRKGTAERYFFFRGAIDDIRIYDRALSPLEVSDEFAAGGFSKPVVAHAITADALSGQWGERGVVFLDLRAEPEGRITGMIMSGRPDNMWPIASGHFDRDTGSIHLEGVAKHPELHLMAPYAIDGLLDGDEITVSATFHDYRGNHTFTRKGAITAV